MKHGHIGIDACLKISPLYNMQTYNGELPEDVKIFKEFQQYIDGDEKKGSQLWKKIASKKPIDTDELRSCLCE